MASVSPNLKSIQSVVSRELDAFQKVFRETITEESPLLTTILRHVLRSRGKRIRPTLVFLSSKICGGISDSSFRAATLLELLHTATLLHDDVVDEAPTRRGHFSVNALWGNKGAVLIGDYFLVKILLHAIDQQEIEILAIISNVVRRLTKGELRQMKEARRFDLDEKKYFQIISDKTASLIGACTMCGAVSAGASTDDIERMKALGEHLGLAFQIRDDLFDYGDQRVGKPVGLDFKKKPLTLPLIYALGNADTQSRRKIKRFFRQGTERKKILQFVEEQGGMEYARQRMDHHIQSAQELLGHYPESPARAAMMSLAEFIGQRKH